MDIQDKTKEELLKELQELKQKNAELTATCENVVAENKQKDVLLQQTSENYETFFNTTEHKRTEKELIWNKTLLELMSNSSPLGFLVVDNRTDDILYFNHRFCQIWEIEHIEDQMMRGELKNNDIIPYCLPVLADIPAFAESCKPLQYEANRVVVEDEIAFTKNRTVHRYSTQIRGEQDEYFGRFYIFEDISKHKRASEFENNLLQLSIQMTGTKSEDIPFAINNALAKIGSFLFADRAYIFEISEDGSSMNNTYEWCSEGTNPEIENLQDLPVSIFPMWMKSLLNKETIQIPSVKDLPESWSTEREILEPQGIQSLVVIPILNYNKLIGFVGLDSVRNIRKYNDSEINNLKLWSNMLAGILTKQHIDEKLIQTRKNYETFFNTINDFLFVLDEQGNIIHTNSTVTDRLGYTWEELSGLSVLMVHPPERRDEAGRIVGEMLSGVTEFCPVPLVTKSGIQIPVETRVSHGFWDGKPVIFGVTKDISRVKLSEEKFSKVFYLNPSACGLSDLDTGEYIEANNQFYTLLGFHKNEVIGKTAIDLGILTQEAINAVMLNADSNGNITNVNADLKARNGDIKHVLLSAENIIVQDKKYRYTIVHDITELKQAEEDRNKQRELLQRVFDHIPVMISYYDETGKFEMMNQEMVKKFGWSFEDWENEPILSKMYPDPEAFKEVLDFMVNKPAGWKDFKTTTKYGTELITSWTNISLPDRSSIGIGQDITERKQAEDEISRQAGMITSLLDSIPDIIFFKDQKGVYLGCNPPFAEFVGQARGEIVGKTDYDLFDKEIADFFRKHDISMLNVLKSQQNEEWITYPDGRKTLIDTLKTPYWGPDGTLIGLLGISRDITERKLAEDEIKLKNEELLKLNSEKDKFFSIIAHDLKSPFNAIVGFSNLLVEQVRKKDYNGIEKYAGIIEQSSNRAMDLLMNLMEWARSQTGRMEFNPEYCEMARLINETIVLYDDIAGQKKISINTNKLPANAVIFADKTMIATVLRNLISNAVKFTHSGGKITISAQENPNELKVSVSDDGVGISKANIQKIFRIEENYTTSGTNKEKGTGLGLILCKEFIEKHEGNIWVESEEGKGSTFYFTLPKEG